MCWQQKQNPKFNSTKKGNIKSIDNPVCELSFPPQFPICLSFPVHNSFLKAIKEETKWEKKGLEARFKPVHRWHQVELDSSDLTEIKIRKKKGVKRQNNGCVCAEFSSKLEGERVCVFVCVCEGKREVVEGWIKWIFKSSFWGGRGSLGGQVERVL